MSELLILALLLVGKIHSQEAVVSQITNLRPLHVPAFDRGPVPYQEYIMGLRTSQPPPRLYTNPPRPAVHDLPQKANGNGNLNLPLAVRENQPERKLFVSAKIPDKMNRPLYDSDPVNNTDYYSNNVYEDITLENKRTSGYVINPAITQNTKIVTTVKPAFVNTNIQNNGSIPVISLDERSSFNVDPRPTEFAKVNGQNTENVTTVPPAFVNTNIQNNGSIPAISLDERSSFNGDPCPAGFAKVNGQCVKADQ